MKIRPDKLVVPIRRLDRRGVALPLALLGLVVVSLLLTAVIVTSSTELAISSAHRDATQALHAADHGLLTYYADPNGFETYLRGVEAAEVQAGIALGTGFASATNAFEYQPSTGRNAPVDMRVQHLSYQLLDWDAEGPLRWRNQFAIHASPASAAAGGRTVTALAETIHQFNRISLDIQGAMTSGADLTVKGNVQISGISQSACDTEMADSVAAITFADGADFTNQSQDEQLIDKGNIEGGVRYETYTREQLLQEVVGTSDLDVLTRNADVKFGFDGFSNWNNSDNPSASYPKSSRLNWGCHPDNLLCPINPYTKIVGIDAQGGEVQLNGNGNGYGMLIIRNGDFKINGTFKYHGIVIVEGVTTISGTADIFGALIAVGKTQVDETASSTVGSGTPIIRYDQCRINEAREAFNDNGGLGSTITMNPNLRWFEVVR